MDNVLRYARIAQMVFNRPLMATPAAAQAVADVIAGRMTGGDDREKPDASTAVDANRFVGDEVRDREGHRRGYRIDRETRTGIITIDGELVNRGAWVGASSGLTSYEGIVAQARAAAGDPEIETIMLDINSPGGEALGMFDTARTLRDLFDGRRSVAIVNSMAASSAYGLASAADEIVIGEGGVAGSIGVVLVHFDNSARLEKAGVRPTVITAGDLKGVGNPFESLTAEDRRHLEAEVDGFMAGFVGLIEDHRGLAEDAIRGQQAALYRGADAVAAGLADRIGTFESVLAENGGAGIRVPAQQQRSLSAMTTENTPAADAGISLEQNARDVAAARADGLEAGRTAERDRIDAIAGHADIGGNLSAAIDLALKSPDMPADDVVAFCAAHVPAAAADSYVDHKARAAGTPGLVAVAAKADDGRPTGARAALTTARERHVDRAGGRRA